MGILNRFADHRESALHRYDTFMATQMGKDKIATSYDGSARHRIIVALDTQGSSTLDEIARASGLRRGMVEGVLVGLVRSGYVQRSNGGNVE